MMEFTEQVISIIKSIPKGKVMSYGQIAANAGNPWGARQVSRILHSMSKSHELPWHRVINSKGEISLKGDGAMIQEVMLKSEGIKFENNKVDFKLYAHLVEFI